MRVLSGVVLVWSGVVWWPGRGITDLVEKESAERAKKDGDAEAPKKKAKKEKPKLGMVDSFRYLLTNKYLGCMCVLVVAYGLAINFTEVSLSPACLPSAPHSRTRPGCSCTPRLESEAQGSV